MNLRYCTLAALAAAMACGEARAQFTTPEVTVNLNDMDVSGYFVADYTPNSANVGTTGSTNLNPAMSLRFGTRYNFSYTNAGSHPFEILARGASSLQDTVQLSMGAAGPMESNAGVGWSETGSSFSFILTGALADAMSPVGKTPGYRCQFHPDDMRGSIAFAPGISPLVWSSATENFENYALATSVESAISGWSVVDAATPSQYSAEISSLPSGHTNQVSGSTRWLTITDTENSSAANGRTYSNGIVVPNPTIVASYKFTCRMDIQSLGTAGPLIVAQHRNNSNAYANVGGLQVTSTGVDAIILGTDGGNIGKLGANSSAGLYAYGDAGGFAHNSWVTVEFEIDFADGVINGRAVGSDGTTIKTAQATGLDLQNADRNDFRFCIRNNGTGNTSVISYDEIVLSGVEGVSQAEGWQQYD